MPALARLTTETIPLMRDGVRPTSSCLATVVYPWSQLTLNDPHFNASNGFPPRKVFVEAVDYLPGLAGESRNFDANGSYIRVLLTAGSLTYSLQPGVFGQAVAPLVATQPTLPPGDRRPPLAAQRALRDPAPDPDLSAPDRAAARPGQVAMKRAIKKHLGDFVAIVVLLVLSIVVAGYILNHERLRFPFIQSAPFTINAEFSTAQAVTPGQGQTVRVSGVQIGDIGGVTLKSGVAVVSMDIDQQYKHLIHTDATALLRPRTGLKDMFIELNPGSTERADRQAGFTIPVANTLPDINVDEILSSLDADTRAYLTLLVNGAGQGLKGNGGTELAQVLERFEPTHRDLARVSQAVAARGTNLRRLVNSLQRLNTALAAKQGQIVSLVDSSARVFRAFASEERERQPRGRRSPGDAHPDDRDPRRGPDVRQPARSDGQQPAAGGACAAGGQPGAGHVRQAGGADRPDADPSVRRPPRSPVVQNLEPASVNLAKATPNLQKVFGVLGHLVNMLGYSPGGGQHGYLWWLSWLAHNTRTLFSVQDANGSVPPAVHPVQLRPDQAADRPGL